ncbi:MAG: hypothetical protein ACYTHJ_19215, partial [Planctomycetota bacterium]
TAGEGFLEFKPSDISITIDESAEQKLQASAQVIGGQNCLDTCSAAGVDETICSNVCDNSAIDVRVYVSTREALADDCTNGDEYSALIRIDDAGNIVGDIVITPNQFTPATLDLINGGAFSACFQVIAPFTGEVIIGDMTINVSL